MEYKSENEIIEVKQLIPTQIHNQRPNDSKWMANFDILKKMLSS